MESILKEKLFNEGYISFNLKDFSEELYNNLVTVFPKGYLNPNMFHNIKHSVVESENYEHAKDTSRKTLGELEIIKNDIIEKFEKNRKCDQVWFYDWPYDVRAKTNPYETVIKPLFKFFYDEESKGGNSQVTMYNDGCYLVNHLDGPEGYYSPDRHCVILIYLTEDYQKGNGGELVLSKTKKKEDELWIEPTYGNVAIFDFTKHNIWHRVEKVKGYNRYCFINFC